MRRLDIPAVIGKRRSKGGITADRVTLRCSIDDAQTLAIRAVQWDGRHLGTFAIDGADAARLAELLRTPPPLSQGEQEKCLHLFNETTPFCSMGCGYRLGSPTTSAEKETPDA